jgi:hypothetical protein
MIKRNYLAMVLHILSGVTLVVLYNVYSASQSRSSIKVFRNQLAASDDTACTTSSGLTPSKCNVDIPLTKPLTLGTFNVIYGAIAFFFITAIAHYFYASDGFGSGAYSKSIAQGWNPYRWFEYGMSATIMTVLIGIVDGTRDIQTVSLLALMTMAMQLCGYSVESQLRGHGPVSSNSKDTIVGITYVGWILFVGIWSILLWSFSNAIHDVKTKYGTTIDPDTNKPVAIPAWIWFIVIMQLVYYALFGLVQWNHIKGRTGPKAADFKYAKTENAYITLSYFAKLSLASGIGYGLIYRTKDCPA